MKKKTFFVLSLTIMLLGLNFSLVQAQAEFVIPANSYTLSSSVGEFTDIANLGGTVKLGENLPHNTLLRNGFFINAVPNNPADAGNFVTHFADKTKTDPGIPLGFNFILCGKKMTHFTICASGGIHFGASANIPQAQSAAWYTSTADFQNILTVSTRDTLNRQDSVLSLAGKAPVMYRIAGDAGQKVLTVQYNYTVNGDEWIYQIKIYEATGRMELIVKDLKNSHAGKGRYQMFFGLVENGNRDILNDPIKTLNLHQCDARRHKVGFNQAQAADWQTFNAYTTDGIGNGMHITANAKPETGRTLAFSIADCAENGACLNPEAYTFEITTVSKTAFSGKISYNKNALTTDELVKTGTIVAVLSTSETPDYTLNDGTWHHADEQIGQARVLLNGKPSYRFYNGNISGNIGALDIKADGLTAGTTYYLHIYSMNYQCLKAPTYSDLCHTFRFTSSIDLPKKLSAGLPTTSSVPVTVQAAGEGFGVVLLKSPNTNPVALSGKLTEGQQIGDIKVLKIIDATDEISFDAPFEAGEGAYILAVSAKNLDSENPTYAADFLSMPVRAAYNSLPSFEFRRETFTYGGPNEYRRLPFGWNRETAFPTGSFDNAFGLGQLDEGPVCLFSSYPTGSDIWADVITPAFRCPTNKFQATFFTAYQKPAEGFRLVRHTPGESDSVRIEYSVNGGKWITALYISGNNEEFPSVNEQGQHPISATISDIPTNAIIRLRYSFKSPNETSTITNSIHSVETVPYSDCETPRMTVFTDSLASDVSLTLQWQDNNFPKASFYVLAYRESENSDVWRYRYISAPTNNTDYITGQLTNLKAATRYNARVAAVCTPRDTSLFSQPVSSQTAYLVPYEESMSQTGVGASAQTPFDRGVKTYTGTIGGPLTESTDANWSQTVTSDTYNRALTVSIGDFTSDAWLMMPATFITKTGNFTPKSLRFTLSSFDADRNKGARPNYDDTKLHVLASSNGIFTHKNIIKTLNAADLALENADIAIDLTEREGYLQIAFVFECPSAYDTSKTEMEPWYIEISQLSLKYDVDVCFSVTNLNRSTDVNSVLLSWSAPFSAVEYGILWGRNSEDGYTDTAYTTEPQYRIMDLEEQTRYKAMVIAYCSEDRSLYSEGATTRFTTLTGCHTPLDFNVSQITATGARFSSRSDQPDYMNLRLVYVWSEIDDNMLIFRQMSDVLTIHDTLAPKTAYIAATSAICGTDTSKMSDVIPFSTTDPASNEEMTHTSALFNVGTQNGQVHIHNLNGTLIKHASIYNINGIKLADLRTESRDDLILPVEARHLLIFVRLQTEKGTAVYKVYLQ